ncbi:hypothetical protein COOONC_22673 [Cooperia oncophora]
MTIAWRIDVKVFKFADKPGVWFFCQIQMCMKKAGMCGGITPPSCASTAPPVEPGEQEEEKVYTTEEYPEYPEESTTGARRRTTTPPDYFEGRRTTPEYEYPEDSKKLHRCSLF